MKRDQGVGLAASVGHLELADGLGALTGQARGDVLRELAQRVRGIGEGEELGGVLVDRGRYHRIGHDADALQAVLLESAVGLGDDFVEVCGEFGQGELAGAELVLEADDLVPRGVGRHGKLAVGAEVGLVEQCAAPSTGVRALAGRVESTAWLRD